MRYTIDTILKTISLEGEYTVPELQALLEGLSTELKEYRILCTQQVVTTYPIWKQDDHDRFRYKPGPFEVTCGSGGTTTMTDGLPFIGVKNWGSMHGNHIVRITGRDGVTTTLGNK